MRSRSSQTRESALSQAWLPAAALISGCVVAACSAPDGRLGSAAATDDTRAGLASFGATTASVRTPVQGAAAASDQLQASRTTAIVEASERAAPAVVTVGVMRRERVRPRTFFESFMLPPGAARRVSGFGSGFVIDSEGIILTNEHVVAGAEQVLVTLPDGRDFDADVVGADPLTDVAVLRIPGDGRPLPAVELGSSRGLLIGEWVVAIGNPFGNLISNPEPSVTAGVVSAVGRHIIPSSEDEGFYLGMIQTDASINPGNSGGPLVNALGRVIGVNSSIFSRSGGSEGLGFAIPIDRALSIAADLLAHGEVRRAWVGVDVEAEPADPADPWQRTRGVRAARVAPDSPAERAGVRLGQRVLRANGRRLANPLDFEAVLLDLRAGDPVELDLEGVARAVSMVTEALPSVNAQRITVLQQLQLITVTPAIQAERDLASERGALIVEIDPRVSANIGLREGDVLIQINSVPIERAEDVERALSQVPDRGRVQLYFERNGGMGLRTLVLAR